MSDENQMMHDLQEAAIYNRCILSWVAAGLISGSLAKPGIGTAVGFLAGLIYGSLTCKPISKKLTDLRFISQSDFQSFHAKINTYYPVSRDEAFALAWLVTTYKSKVVSCTSPPNFRYQLEELLSVART